MDDEDREFWFDEWTAKNSVGCAVFEIALWIAIVIAAAAVMYWTFIPPVKTWIPE